MKIIQRLLTALFVVLATCCVLNIYNVRSETSKTFGNFDHYDLYEDFNVFEMDENVVFYNDNGTYKFTKTYPIKVDFDGSENEYNLFVNNKPCDTIKSTAGSLYGVYGLSFYDINNQYICDFDLQIRYTFYVSNFELSIESNCTADELKYLNEYLNVNGFNLRIIEKVYYVPNEDVLSKVYASFYDENDTLLGVQNTLYNQTLSAPNYNVPAKTGYTFKGWTIDGKNVIDFETYKFTKNVKLKPYYEINKYIVTFKNGEEILETQTVDYGASAAAPSVTPAIGYTHTGWDKAFTNITEDIVVNATFEKIQYTINYYDDNEQLLQSKNYTIGESIDITAPELTGHTFLSWNTDHYAYYPDYDIVLDTLDVDFITKHFSQSLILNVFARYEIKTYTVAFKNGNEILSTQTINYGSSATAPTVNAAIGYKHTGWDKSFNNVNSNLIVNAVFAKIQYTISFCNEEGTDYLGSTVFTIGDKFTYQFTVPEGYNFDCWVYSLMGTEMGILDGSIIDEQFITTHLSSSSSLTVLAKLSQKSYSITWLDNYLTIKKDSSSGTVLSNNAVVHYNDKIYVSCSTRTNYTRVIKVNGETISNNTIITILGDTSITVSWTYVAPPVSYTYIEETKYSGEYGDDPVTFTKPTGCVSFEIISIMQNGNEFISSYSAAQLSSATTETSTTVTINGSSLYLSYDYETTYKIKFKVQS